MGKGYSLPEIRPDESNNQWLRRAAESIPAEALMRQIVDHLMRPGKRRKGEFKRWTYAWSKLGEMIGHGSGVSGAIVDRFRTKEATNDDQPKNSTPV